MYVHREICSSYVRGVNYKKKLAWCMLKVDVALKRKTTR